MISSNGLHMKASTDSVGDGMASGRTSVRSATRLQVNTSDIVTTERMPGEWVVVCPVNAHLADICSLDPAAIRWRSPLIHTLKISRLRLVRSAGSRGGNF